MTTAEQPRILIVEDEKAMREGMQRILTNRGLTVQTAADGQEALNLIKRDSFPVVLVDLKMPGMDGFQLLEHINRLKPDTVCVVVSAFATVEAIVDTTKKGVLDFVVKPFLPADLLAVVERAIDKWRSAAEMRRLREEREAHLLQLANEQSRLRTIVQSMGDGLLVINIDRQVVLDNRAARLLLWRHDRPCLGEAVQAILPDQKIGAEIDRLLRSPREPQVRLDTTLEVGEGRRQTVDLRVTLASFCDEQEHVLGVLVLLTDISEAKAYERMKTLFISHVAHEIKAPIAAVQSYLALIEDGTLDGDLGQIKEIARRCMQRNEALLTMVQDLLEITRREVVQRNRVMEPLELQPLIARMMEFHRPLADGRKVTLELQCSEKLPTLLADTTDVEQVFTNILSNAIKYNRDGGRVWVRLRTAGDMLVLEVQDTGFGLTPEEVKRIGEEFFRVKNDRTRHIPGSGLGLALVRKILKFYQGALEVESSPGEGSCFRVLWPLSGKVEVAHAENGP